MSEEIKSVQSDEQPFSIPEELQPYCNEFLTQRREHLDKLKHRESSGAIKRSIELYENNPEFLVREVQYLLENEPKFFGIEPEKAEEVEVVEEEKPIQSKKSKKTKRKLPRISDDEKSRIMKAIDQKFLDQDEEEILGDIATGRRIQGRLRY